MTDLADIVETFDLLGDWDQRYAYLIELGERLPAMSEALKTEENHVKPCMSTVHVSAYRDPAHPERIRYHGDCDTPIIKGVLALLIELCSGRSVEAIQAIDMDEIFERLQLGEHLSPNRHVGIYAIVDLMKAQAERLGAKATA
ncbi:MAG: SufE family protein [Gammaproteobacteria bacterium]|jgi:cysteine desulfuration protein SufE|nr:SufE family protein [Gammaproteobacteria bacterium]